MWTTQSCRRGEDYLMVRKGRRICGLFFTEWASPIKKLLHYPGRTISDGVTAIDRSFPFPPSPIQAST